MSPFCLRAFLSSFGVSLGLNTSIKVWGQKQKCKKIECKEKLLGY